MAYDYPTAFSSWGPEEEAAIDRVLASGQWTMNGETAAFEDYFAAYHGRKYGVMTNSGSSANLVATAALFHVKDNPLRRGDRAVVPAMAWSTTYSPLMLHDLDLVVADVDAGWNAVPNRSELMNSPRVRLLVLCPVLGNPANYAEWGVWNDLRDTFVIEDACESLGAHQDGKLCGTFGMISTFSFFYSHQVSAVESGICLTDDPELYRLMKMVRAHGWTRDVEKADLFDSEYRFEIPGLNVRPTEIYAAVASEQFRKLPTFIEARRANYFDFLGLTEDFPITPVKQNGFMSPFGLHFTVADNATRLRLVTALRAESIDCRQPCGGSFLRHPYSARWQNQRTPFADRIHDTGMFLGNPPWPAPDLIERAVAVMRRVL